jgi:hypothetical protein
MKLLDRISNSLYKAKSDKIMYYERIFKLQEECSKFDMFTGIGEFSSLVIENQDLNCFYEEGEKIGSLITKKTYYFFRGNICIVYNKSGYDRIIRILIKSPEDKWAIYKELGDDGFYHLKTKTKYVEVYDWWDVDWMSCGKRDYGTNLKEGSWWKTVYDDVCGIYEYVAKMHVDYVFNNIYSEYEKAQK